MKDETSPYSTNVTSVNVTLSFVAINIGGGGDIFSMSTHGYTVMWLYD